MVGVGKVVVIRHDDHDFEPAGLLPDAERGLDIGGADADVDEGRVLLGHDQLRSWDFAVSPLPERMVAEEQEYVPVNADRAAGLALQVLWVSLRPRGLVILGPSR